jgi:hypothetical protein
MATIQLEVSRENLLEAIEQLENDELSDFVNEVLHVRARRFAPVLDHQESELFQKINQWLSEEETRRRDELLKKLDAETLTELEHEELMQLNDKVEWLNVQRLKAFIQLAELRQKTIEELMNDMGIKSLSDV